MKTKILTIVIIIAVIMAGASLWALRDQRHHRQDLQTAIEVTHEARTESDKQVEDIKLQQQTYVERVKSRDETAYREAVMIDDQVRKYSEAIPSDDIGRAIELELELYDRSLGTGIAWLEGD